MIAKLKGLVDSVAEDHAIIDVGGVGYLVFASARTLGRLPATGEAVAVLTEMDVGEDHMRLYGFLEAAERDWFRLLTTVQGVGARVALAILSVASPTQVAQAIAAGDKAPLTRASGVGPKLAARICSELRDKAAALATGLALSKAAGTGAAPTVDIAAGPVEEATSALVNLGYQRLDAFNAAGRAFQQLGEGATVAAVIGAALKEIGKELAK